MTHQGVITYKKIRSAPIAVGCGGVDMNRICLRYTLKKSEIWPSADKESYIKYP